MDLYVLHPLWEWLDRKGYRDLRGLLYGASFWQDSSADGSRRSAIGPYRIGLVTIGALQGLQVMPSLNTGNLLRLFLRVWQTRSSHALLLRCFASPAALVYIWTKLTNRLHLIIAGVLVRSMSEDDDLDNSSGHLQSLTGGRPASEIVRAGQYLRDSLRSQITFATSAFQYLKSLVKPQSEGFSSRALSIRNNELLETLVEVELLRGLEQSQRSRRTNEILSPSDTDPALPPTSVAGNIAPVTHESGSSEPRRSTTGSDPQPNPLNLGQANAQIEQPSVHATEPPAMNRPSNEQTNRLQSPPSPRLTGGSRPESERHSSTYHETSLSCLSSDLFVLWSTILLTTIVMLPVETIIVRVAVRSFLGSDRLTYGPLLGGNFSLRVREVFKWQGWGFYRGLAGCIALQAFLSTVQWGCWTAAACFAGRRWYGWRKPRDSSGRG